MAWWSRRQSEKSVEKKAVLGTSDTFGKFLRIGTTSAEGPASSLGLYEQSTAVSVPINFVADPFSVVEPALLLGDKIVREHPVLDLLKSPSPFFSQELFLETIAKDYLVTGEFLVVALGLTNKPPLELQPISPKVATPVRGMQGDAPDSWFVSGNTLTGTYKAVVEGKRIRYFDDHNSLRELKHVRNYSPKDNSLLRGRSPLVPASKEVRSHILGTEHNVSILEKGGRVSLVFHFDEDMSQEDFDAKKEEICSQFGGATQAGTIGMTTGGKLQIEEFGQTNKDMDWGVLQMMVIKAVALQYHVPLPLILELRQTFSNYREAKLALYDDAVIPLSRRVFGGLGGFLLPRYGLDPTKAKIILDPESVTALVMRRNEELDKRSKIGIETDNELRSMLGREPIEGGDVLLKPATMIPIGSDLFTEDNDPELLEDPNELSGASDE